MGTSSCDLGKDITVTCSEASNTDYLFHFCKRLGENICDAAILDMYNKKVPIGRLLGTIKHNVTTLLLLDEKQNPNWLGSFLLTYGFTSAKLDIGEKLFCTSERIISGTPAELVEHRFSGRCVARVANKYCLPRAVDFGLCEEYFCYEDKSMLTAEIRAAILAYLKLNEEAIVWVVGAGTSSVAVECARLCHYGVVHALEWGDQLLQCIQEDKEWNGLRNLTIHDGKIASAINRMPKPTNVFIYGGDKNLAEILRHIPHLGYDVRVVVLADDQKTAALAANLMCRAPYEFMEATQMMVCSGITLNCSQTFPRMNAVTLLGAWTC